MKKILLSVGLFAVATFLFGWSQLLEAAVYTIPQQNITVPPADVRPMYDTINHVDGTVQTQLDVLDANKKTIDRIVVSYPLTELGVTTSSLEQAQAASQAVVDAVKAAIVQRYKP